MDEYSELEALAKKVSGGRWMAIGRHVENTNDNISDICACDLSNNPARCKDLAAYIAASQPSVVLSLIEHVRALRDMTDKDLELDVEFVDCDEFGEYQEQRANAVIEFVDYLIGAFISGHTTNTLTLAQLRRVAEIHCADTYGVNYENIVECHGEDIARACGANI